MTDLTYFSNQIVSDFRRKLFRQRFKNSRPKKVTSLVIYVFLLLIIPVTNHVIAQSSNVYSLKEGVLVDPVNNMIYLMSPQGGLEAVNLTGGVVEWQTEKADKPLALVSDSLFGQVENQTRSNELNITILDVANEGRQLADKKIALPENVKISVDDKLGSSFKAYAIVQDRSLYLSWDFKSLPKQGFVEEKPGEEQPDPTSPAIIPPKAEKGLIRLNLVSDQAETLDPAIRPTEMKPKILELKSDQRKPSIPGRQFYSVDNSSIAGIERIAADDQWIKYRWTVFDASGNRKDSFNSHFSYMPFYVSGSQVVFITSPYILKKEEKIIEEPLKLRAISLETGEELWSKAVRDTEYRGPFPP